MKRMTSFLLVLTMALVMVLSMFACGGGDVTTTVQTTIGATTIGATTTTRVIWADPVPPPRPPMDFDGEGTQEDPFLIDSKEKLLKLVEKSAGNNYAGQYFKQTVDIVLNDTSVENWWEAENAQQWGIIKTFGGIYDGGGHVIEGLLIEQEWNQPYDQMKLGFIGEGVNCTVKNLGFRQMRIVVTHGAQASGAFNQATVGGIVAFTNQFANACATIENCAVDCYINAIGENADQAVSGGAIFGYAGGGVTVRNCFAIGEVNTHHGVFASGGAQTCTVDGVVSLLTSLHPRICDWSAGVDCSNFYLRADGPPLGGDGWRFDASCAEVSLHDLTGDAAKTACAGLDFENVWQANAGKLPSLKIFGEKLIFDVPEAPAE